MSGLAWEQKKVRSRVQNSSTWTVGGSVNSRADIDRAHATLAVLDRARPLTSFPFTSMEIHCVIWFDVSLPCLIYNFQNRTQSVSNYLCSASHSRASAALVVLASSDKVLCSKLLASTCERICNNLHSRRSLPGAQKTLCRC
jgi:hypothetical protein